MRFSNSSLVWVAVLGVSVGFAGEQLDDLVEQVHAASMQQRTHVLSNAVGVESLWPYNAWGDNMWALSLLYLNERVDEVNDRIQSLALTEEPFAYFGAVDYVKILALFNSQSPHFPGRLEPATEAAMKEILWQWAKEFEEYWEPSRLEAAEPEGSVWSVYASENHDLIRKGNNHIIFSVLADDPAYRSLICTNGHTVAEYDQLYTTYFKKWLQERAASGLWMELGAEYAKYSYSVLFNLVDLSPDPEIRTLAKMVLDLAFIEEAQCSFADGFRGGGKSRTPRTNPELVPGMMQHKRLLFGEVGSATHSRVFETSSYQVPDIAIFLREFGDGEPPFLMRNRVLGESVAPSQSFAAGSGDTFYIAEDSALVNVCYKTPDYMIGSTLQLLDDANDGYGDDSGITRQDRWGGIVFNDAVHSKVLPWAERTPGTSTRVHNAYWQVQHENLMIAQKTDRSAYTERMMVYLTPTLDLTETNGWVFASTGNAWSAVKAVGGYSWGEATHSNFWPGTTFLIPTNEYAPIVFFAGSTHDGFISYEAFQNYVLNDIVLQETPNELLIQRPGKPDIQFFTDYREPIINDADADNPYNADPTLRTETTYDSPYLKTGAKRSEVIAQWGEYRWIYDFEAIEIRAAFGGTATNGVVGLDFGADYSSVYINAGDAPVMSTVDADFDGDVDDRMASIAFGTAYSPVDSVNFTTPAEKSGPGLKYGMSLANIDSTLEPVSTINRFTYNDDTYINGITNDVPGISRRMATAWCWEKSDFLNDANYADHVSFADEEGSLELATNLAGTPEPGTMRGAAFLAQSDGQWYVTSLLSAGYTSVFSINGATENWYVFDPAEGTLFFDRSDYGPSVPGSSLTNLTALGLYTQTELIDGSLYHGFKTIKAVLDYSFDPLTAEGWYDAWSQRYPGHDMSLSSDPDGDRVSNLVEYGLGGNPTGSDAGFVLPTAGANADLFSHVYSRRLDAEARGLTYRVEVNSNLFAETWTTNGVSEMGQGAGRPGFESVTNAVSVDLNKKFMRLRIEMSD